MESSSQLPLSKANTLSEQSTDHIHSCPSEDAPHGVSSNGSSVMAMHVSSSVSTQLEAKGFVYLSKILNRLNLSDVTLEMGSNTNSNPVFFYNDNPYLGWRRAVQVIMSGNQAGKLAVMYNPPALNNNFNSRIVLTNMEECTSFLTKKGLPHKLLEKFKFGVRCVCQRQVKDNSDGTEYVPCAFGKAGCNGYIHKVGCMILPPKQFGTQEYICPLCTNYLIAIGEDHKYRNSAYSMIEKACCEGSQTRYTVKISNNDSQDRIFTEYSRPHPFSGFWNKESAPGSSNSAVRMNGKVTNISSSKAVGAFKGGENSKAQPLTHVLLSKIDGETETATTDIDNNHNEKSSNGNGSSHMNAGNVISMSADHTLLLNSINGSSNAPVTNDESHVDASTANENNNSVMLPTASQSLSVSIMGSTAIDSEINKDIVVDGSAYGMVSRGINLVMGRKIGRPKRSLIANLQLENAQEEDNIDSGDEHTVPTFDANADSMYFDRWATYPDGRRVLVRVDGGWMKRGEDATSLITGGSSNSSSSTGMNHDLLIASDSDASLEEPTDSIVSECTRDVLRKLAALERSSRATGTGLPSMSASLKTEWIVAATIQIPCALENDHTLSKHSISRNPMFSWMPLEDGTIRHVSALPAGNLRSLHVLCTSCRLCAYCLHSLNISEKVSEHKRTLRNATNKRKSPHERTFLRKFGSVEYHVHESCAFMIDNTFFPTQEHLSLATTTASTAISTSSAIKISSSVSKSASASASSSSKQNSTDKKEVVDMNHEYVRLCASIDRMKKKMRDLEKDMNMNHSSTVVTLPADEKESLFRNFQGNPFDAEVDHKRLLEGDIFGNRQMWLLEDDHKDGSDDDDDDEMDESDGVTDNSPRIAPSFSSSSSSFSSSHHHTEIGLSAADKRAIESVVHTDRASNQWSCEACTFSNLPRATKCEVCQTPRPHDYGLAATSSNGLAFADDANGIFDYRGKDNTDLTVNKIPTISNLSRKGNISSKDFKNYLHHTRSTFNESLKLQSDTEKTGISTESTQVVASTTSNFTTATATSSANDGDRNCRVTCTSFVQYESIKDLKKCDLCQKSGAVLQSYSIEINSTCLKEGVAHPACINWFERSTFLPLIKSKVECPIKPVVNVASKQQILEKCLNNEVDRCSICGSKGGIIVRCAGAGCAVKVHPTCAIILGGDWRVCEFTFKQQVASSDDTSNTGEVVGVLCPSHGVGDSLDRSTLEENIFH